MLDFITVPIVIGVSCLGVYSLFESFIRKKERLAIMGLPAGNSIYMPVS